MSSDVMFAVNLMCYKLKPFVSFIGGDYCLKAPIKQPSLVQSLASVTPHRRPGAGRGAPSVPSSLPGLLRSRSWDHCFSHLFTALPASNCLSWVLQGNAPGKCVAWSLGPGFKSSM